MLLAIFLRYVKATNLYLLNLLTINIESFLKLIIIALKDFEYLTRKGVCIYDIMYNIMLGDNLYIIDTVEYTRRNMPYEVLKKHNLKGFTLEILYFLIDDYFDEFISTNPELNAFYQAKPNISIIDFIIKF